MTIRSAPVRRRLGLVPLVITAFLLSSCRFGGVNEMVLPGGIGTGDHALHVTAQLPDVGTLTTNAQVKVGDIAVGTVTSVKVVNWHAEVGLSIQPDVELPANAVARVGVNTLLGAAYVELAPPARPAGRLADGADIPLARGHAYASTEQVLSAASVALNGGGLEQVSTITRELNNALGGHDHAVPDLLPRMNSFVATVNDQRGQVLRTVQDMNTLAQRLDRSHEVIDGALDELGPAVDALARNRPDLVRALQALTRLGDVASPLVDRVRADLVANLTDLEPTLRALRMAGPALVRGLGFAVTFPFAPETVQNACRGSYCNLDLTLDLTNGALVNGFTTPSGGVGIPGLPGLDVGGILAALLGVTSTGGLLGPLAGLTSSPGDGTAAPGSDQNPQPDPIPGDTSGLGTVLGGLVGGL